MKPISKENSELLLLMLMAFAFSMTVRMIWVFFSSDMSSFFWNGQLMINTNDGYFYAEGARDVLNGFHQNGDASAYNTFASEVTAAFAYLLPFSFETIILYMPAVLSSLVVIPIILIGRSLGNVQAGFIAALLTSIAWSYYNRTMMGYYDTDMLNIVFPAMLLWTLVLAFKTQEEKYLLFMALDIIAYRLWYPQSYALDFSFFAIVLLYILVKDRKNIFLLKLVTMMLLAMMGLPTIVRVVLVIATYMLFKKEQLNKFVYYALALAFVLFMFSGGFDPIWGKLKLFVFRSSAQEVGEGIKFNFYGVAQTISEAKEIPFETFVNRISGSLTVFILSLIGYILLAVRHKVMLLALPLVGLGFMAYGIPGVVKGGGLRFTIYAIVPLALGMGYLITYVTQLVVNEIKEDKKRYVVAGVLITSAAVAVIYPNITHAFGYKVPTVMSKTEVGVLDSLHKKADREDYVVAWWDYGFPIRYYSDVKTLADGGGHDGQTNYPVALALTQPQAIAAKVARIAVENREKRLETNSTSWNTLPEILRENHFTSSYEALRYLYHDDKPLEKTRDIYFYLPLKMIRIFPVVDAFSNLDIMHEGVKHPSMLQMFPVNVQGDRYVFTPGLYFSKKDRQLHNGNKSFPVKAFHRVQYDSKGVLQKQQQVLNSRGHYHIVYLPSYNKIMLLDEKAYNSTYVQLFFFENYDPKYFEPSVLTPNAKIFKVKI